MELYFSDKIINLAEILGGKLYAVGGYVRNFLIDGSFSEDIDLAAPIGADTLMSALDKAGLKVVADYKRTGTVVFSDGERKYEFTSFRKDVGYTGGAHTPEKVVFTDDILKDALRRDFKCNAVYYDIKNGNTVDPLGGAEDIKNRVIDTVTSPEKVFCHDGLRLMRLARFSAELNFKPKSEVLAAAKKFAANVRDVSPERIFSELKLILKADKKYPFSDKDGHYTGLKILDDARILDYFIPELTAGRGMVQRADYHDHDVLEHSLRCVRYAKEKVRLFALLHDVGKPASMQKYGRYHYHADEGYILAETVLKRLRADVKTIKESKFIAKYHMFDLSGNVRENKVRIFIVKHLEYIDDLLSVMQADFSACKDDLSTSPVVEKWRGIITKMNFEGAPRTLSDLAISGNDLLALGINGKAVGETLSKLFLHCVINPKDNVKEKLVKLAFLAK